MSVTLLLFLLAACVLIGLLLWAVRPQQRELNSRDEILRSLTEERHYSRLPPIMQSLQAEDFRFLRNSGHKELERRLRSDRIRIALHYLHYLQTEYELLLSAAAVLSSMTPDLAPMEEWDRLKLSLRFSFYSRYLQWKLRLGLAPSEGLASLSKMASDTAVRLESAMGRISERAALASEMPSLLEKGRGDSL